jgi:hypothetical protein
VGLSLVLAFVGIKMFIGDRIPELVSLAVVAGLLLSSAVFSLVIGPGKEPPEGPPTDPSTEPGKEPGKEQSRAPNEDGSRDRAGP